VHPLQQDSVLHPADVWAHHRRGAPTLQHRGPFVQVLADSGLSLDQISSVELTGGSSRVPIVVQVVQQDPAACAAERSCKYADPTLQALFLGSSAQW
jgi:Hsp70 protein